LLCGSQPGPPHWGYLPLRGFALPMVRRAALPGTWPEQGIGRGHLTEEAEAHRSQDQQRNGEGTREGKENESGTYAVTIAVKRGILAL
jgi:hypothetical protein